MNKKVIYRYFLIALFAINTLNSNKDYELFLKANQFCKNGQYKEAFNCYDEIKIKSGSVLYNMGYALYALGNYEDALMVWRQAERKTSGSLFYKIQNGIKKIFNKTEGSQSFFWYDFFISIQQGVWIGFWQYVILFSIVVLIFLLCIVRKNSISFKFKILLGIYGILFFIGIIKVFSYYYIQGTDVSKWALVAKNNFPLYLIPNSNSHKIKELNKGTLVKLVDENDVWCKIHNSYVKGWVQREGLYLLQSM